MATHVNGNSAALELFSQQEVDRYNRATTDAATITRAVDKIVLRTQEDAIKVHEILTDVKRVQTQIEDTKREQVDPLNAQVKAINATWKPITEKLSVLTGALNRKLLAFQQAERERVVRKQAEARRKQEEAQRKEQEALAKAEAAKNSKVREKALAVAQQHTQELMEARLAEPMPAPTGIRSDLGTTFTRFEWDFKVTDPAQVPRQYLMVDEKAIRRAVKQDGIREIPGVSIYEEERLVTRVVG